MLKEIVGYPMTAPKKEMRRTTFSMKPLQADEVLVEIAGCGVCHTDVGFYEGEVKTKKECPLILGHEISGKIVATGEKYESLQDRAVIIPAVIPCGKCELCQKDLANLCREQIMPGNDIHGGFASHIIVPGRFLYVINGDLGEYELRDLCVIADAVTTPYQSMLNAQVGQGDFVIVIGVGGIGTYGVQIAATLGARVVAIDIDDGKLERMRNFGAHAVWNARTVDLPNLKKSLGREAPSPYCWKVFEMSGTLSGQTLAFQLLTFGGTLGVVGFTKDKGEFRLSNLMAFGAQAFGNWGCHPRHYGSVFDLVRSGKIQIKPFIRHYPLSEINEVFKQAHEGHLKERPILAAKN